MAIYLVWSLLNIIITFFLLLRIIPLSVLVFKLCIVLLLTSLFLPISYAFFIQANVQDILVRLYNVSGVHLMWGGKEMSNRVYKKLNENISAMGRLTLHALHDHDEKIFNIGLSRISALGKLILASSKIDPKYLNDLFKNLISNYLRISLACINARLENYLREALTSMTGLITYGIRSKNPTSSKINYP